MCALHNNTGITGQEQLMIHNIRHPTLSSLRDETSPRNGAGNIQSQSFALKTRDSNATKVAGYFLYRTSDNHVQNCLTFSKKCRVFGLSFCFYVCVRLACSVHCLSFGYEEMT